MQARILHNLITARKWIRILGGSVYRKSADRLDSPRMAPISPSSAS